MLENDAVYVNKAIDGWHDIAGRLSVRRWLSAKEEVATHSGVCSMDRKVRCITVNV